MDDLEKFFNELRDALIGSEILLMPETPLELGIFIRPTPFEADRMVSVVRELLTTKIDRLRGIEVRLIALLDKHITDSGQYTIAPAEIENVITPGSAPMYPHEAGYAATCSLCAPDGDGVSFRRGKRND